ncbi:MAG TPA: hypothetical protein VLA56_01030 [Pseudomonadales bacterium]|nr:hypothetical protein [Pseudomonadales bacterium]
MDRAAPESANASETRPVDDQGIPWRDKSIAAAAHLVVSAAAAGGLLLLSMRLWYPGFFFTTDGGLEGVRLALLVTLVLGPGLTFVVFRRGKRGLLSDMVLICMLQVAALAAGAWVLASERPIALVFNEDRFFSLSAGDYLESGRPVPDLSALPGPIPKQVAIQLPDDPIAQSDLRRALLAADVALYTHAPLFEPLARQAAVVRRAGVPRAWLEQIDDVALAAFLTREGGSFEDWAFVPYSARFGVLYLAIRRSDGSITGALDVSSQDRSGG